MDLTKRKWGGENPLRVCTELDDVEEREGELLGVSLGASVLSADVPKVMIELVDQDVRIVQIPAARNVDRLFPMNITAQRFLFSPRKPNSERGALNPIMFG